MKVYEYFPNFVDHDDAPRSAEIDTAEDALGVDWLKAKGADRVDGEYVMAGKWVVGIIRRDH